MVTGIRQHREKHRPAAAAVELALLLPFLSFLLVIAVDWARVFYYSLTLENCARQGALYGSGAAGGSTIQQAALADAPNLSPQPTVASTAGTGPTGDPTISVTVSGTLQLFSNYVGIGNSVNVSHTVTMRMVQ
jgi:Flp pilus assembly protein TadG